MPAGNTLHGLASDRCDYYLLWMKQPEHADANIIRLPGASKQKRAESNADSHREAPLFSIAAIIFPATPAANAPGLP